MRILILHDPVDADARPDEQDTLAQARAISTALGSRGHDVVSTCFSTDLGSVVEVVTRSGIDVVFNLVESVARQGRLIHVPPALLEACGVPFTGASSEAMFLSSSKRQTKRVLTGAGLPTPAWHTREELLSGVELEAERWIVKSVWEHGSLGIEADSVVATTDPATLLEALDARLAALGGEAFVEAYVHGREFNVAVLGEREGPRCLPIPEIGFEGLPSHAPHVVGYRAKWTPGTPEWDSTPRVFLDETLEADLAEDLRRLALETWSAFGLAGWARVDFRVDGAGRPFAIDVNANPCLAPDAGFAAALERAGISYVDAIERIALDARVLRRP